jgi:hypothetical protein
VCLCQWISSCLFSHQHCYKYQRTTDIWHNLYRDMRFVWTSDVKWKFLITSGFLLLSIPNFIDIVLEKRFVPLTVQVTIYMLQLKESCLLIELVRTDFPFPSLFQTQHARNRKDFRGTAISWFGYKKDVTLLAETDIKKLHFEFISNPQITLLKNSYVACSKHKMPTFYCHYMLNIDVVWDEFKLTCLSNITPVFFIVYSLFIFSHVPLNSILNFLCSFVITLVLYKILIVTKVEQTASVRMWKH